MKMKFLPECCSSKCVDNLTAKKWEREISCNQTWAKIQWKPKQECVREGVSECVGMRELNTTADLYLNENEQRSMKRGRPQQPGNRWNKWGPHNGYQGSADLGVRPTPWWARCCSSLAVELQQSYGRWPWGAQPEFARKYVKIIFQRILKLINIWYFFVKC